MGRICEISQIRSARYLPVSSRRRKKRNLRTDDNLRAPGGASLPAANVPVVLPSSTRPMSRISLSGSNVSRVCNAPRKCARFLPLRIRRNVFYSLLSGLHCSLSLSSLAALCLFLFPPTPDAANCAHPDEILVPSAPRLALQLASLPSPFPFVDPSSSKKTRSRYMRPLYSPERGGTTNSLYSPTVLVIVPGLTIIRCLVISRRGKVSRKNVFQKRSI